MRSLPLILFSFQLVVLLAIIWLLPVFPTQDGPSHLYSTHVLLHLSDAHGVAPHARYADYYEVAVRLVPNWLGSLLLLGFGSLVPLPVAERIVVSTCVLVFALGCASLLRGERGAEVPPIVVAVPSFAWGFWLHMGFYSYSIGLALVPWGWLAVMRVADDRNVASRKSISDIAVLAALGMLAFFAHPVAAFAIGLGALAVTAIRAFDPRPGALRVLARVAFPLAPMALLSGFYLLDYTSANPTHWTLRELLASLATLDALSSYYGIQGELAAGLAVALALMLMAALRDPAAWRANAVWLLLATGLLVAYLAIPDGDGRVAFLSARLSVLPWLALFPVLARLQCGPITARALAVGLFALGIGAMGAGVPGQLAASRELAGVLAMAERIAPGSTLLTLDYSERDRRPGRPRARVFLHVAGRLAIERDAIDVADYESRTDHFPLRLAREVEFPIPRIVENRPELIDIEAWEDEVAYLLVRTGDSVPAHRQATIERLYRRVGRHGSIELHERLARRPGNAP